MSDDAVGLRRSLAERVARTAGAAALDLYRGRATLELEMKGRHDRVTEADRRVEALIRAKISGVFPHDEILGEEGGLEDVDLDARSLWVIDPIDGTDCFVFGLPMWSISIAWMENGAVSIGVIYDPIHNELYSAALGRGACLNGTPIRAAEGTDLGTGLVGIGHSSRISPDVSLAALERLMARGGMFHRCGSGALSLAWVASGRLLGYFEAHINAWDCLAGILLVAEAGGWHSDFLADEGLSRGNPLTAAAPNVVEDMRFVAGLG